MLLWKFGIWSHIDTASYPERTGSLSAQLRKLQNSHLKPSSLTRGLCTLCYDIDIDIDTADPLVDD